MAPTLQPIGPVDPAMPAVPPQRSPAVPGPLPGAKTLLGFSPEHAGARHPQAAQIDASGQSARRPAAANEAVGPARPEAAARTLLGVSPLPADQARLSPRTVPGIHPPDAADPAGSAPLVSSKRTMLGVARPGIAPLHPGVEKPPGSPQYTPSSYPPPPGPAPTSQPPPPLPSRPRPMLFVALAVGAAALFLLTLALLIAFGMRGTGPIRAQVGVAPGGGEQLELVCAECKDGTTVALGGATAAFRATKATLFLDRPLAIGKNELTLLVSEPGQRHSREVKLEAPVEYRVRGDFSGLSEPAPKLRVLVEAVRDTAIVVDGNAIPMTSDGQARHQVDVTGMLTGASAGVQPLERKFPYAITPPAATAQRGEVVLKIGIVPLEVEAPGESIVIESPNFMLAGRTLRGGTVTVAGRPITVDGAGQFAQLMNVSAVGETTIVVRGSAPDHAPRLFPIKVRRVQSLRDEARTFAERATTSYAALGSDIDAKRGWLVVFDGDVSESRLSGQTTVALLDVRSGCKTPPCLARLSHGARLNLERGERITAYGRITGSVEGPRTGTRIPALTLDFLLRGK